MIVERRARLVPAMSPASSTPTSFFPRIEVEMQRRSAQPATLPPVIIADGAGGSCEFRKFWREFFRKFWPV